MKLIFHWPCLAGELDALPGAYFLAKFFNLNDNTHESSTPIDDELCQYHAAGMIFERRSIGWYAHIFVAPAEKASFFWCPSTRRHAVAGIQLKPSSSIASCSNAIYHEEWPYSSFRCRNIDDISTYYNIGTILPNDILQYLAMFDNALQHQFLNYFAIEVEMKFI